MQRDFPVNKHRTGWKRFAALLLAGLLTVCTGCGASASGSSTSPAASSVAAASESTVVLADGSYTADVTLEGGSGKASVKSPCEITVSGGAAEALIEWSSSHYDYMVVDGKRYENLSTEGNSTFRIPVEAFDTVLSVQADTTAMSEPHLIDYTLEFHLTDGNESASSAAESSTAESGSASASFDLASVAAPAFSGLSFTGEDERDIAACYRIFRYENGYTVIAVDDAREYLVVPEGAEDPADLDDVTRSLAGDGITLVKLKAPLNAIYLAATAAMCQFDSIGAISDIKFSSLEADSWYIDAAKEAMEKGEIAYGGKYSAPDYELLLSGGADLAIESTMILHTPKVQEKLESLGIPVFIDRSGYETEPLGRSEWVKVYGCLTGNEEKANAAYGEQKSLAAQYDNEASTGLKVAVCSVNSSGQAVTRKKNDYFGKMINAAGGVFVTPDTEDDGSAVSTVTVSFEEFYTAAKDADVLIYNSTIENAPSSIAELEEKSSLFKSFKAVQDGRVYVTDPSFYQRSNAAGEIMRDIHSILTETEDDTEYLHPLV